MKRFFVFCVFTSLVWAQEPVPGNEIFSLPPFYYELLNYAGDSLNTRVDLLVQVPFNKVQFVKDQDMFRGEYALTFSIYDEDKSTLLQERTWTEKVQTADFQASLSKNNFNISKKSFNLRPKKYFIRLQFEDKDSKRTFTTESFFIVKDFSQLSQISDVLLLVPASGTPSKIVPNISRVVQTKDNSLPFHYEIYSDSARKVTLLYTVTNAGGQMLLRREMDRMIPAGKTTVLYAFDSLSFESGEFSLSVSLFLQDLTKIGPTEKKFTSRLSGLPFIIKDLDKAVNQLVYIAMPSQLDSIKSAKTYDEKLTRFINFWKSKDPNLATEENEIFDEYYRRVDYANRNFSHYGEGWRSDMGMVYIILGPPNNIERHPFEYDSKPYEVWDYYDINKQFVFVDMTGFGDYRLITPMFGDTYRFR
jgi:GWxTD domain-containing protein